MRTILLALCMTAFLAPQSSVASPPAEKFHIMWTSAKGKAKCCNKKSKEKADKCAEKMRAKGRAKDVQVMAGMCKDMGK
jgi:hypothetical protein